MGRIIRGAWDKFPACIVIGLPLLAAIWGFSPLGLRLHEMGLEKSEKNQRICEKLLIRKFQGMIEKGEILQIGERKGTTVTKSDWLSGVTTACVIPDDSFTVTVKTDSGKVLTASIDGDLEYTCYKFTTGERVKVFVGYGDVFIGPDCIDQSYDGECRRMFIGDYPKLLPEDFDPEKYMRKHMILCFTDYNWEP